LKNLIVRVCPSSEFLNLAFGITAGAAINLLTSVALGDLSRDKAMLLSSAGVLLFVGSTAFGALAVVVTRLRSEALEGLGPSLSLAERNAEVRAKFGMAAGRLGTLLAAAVLLCVAGLCVLLIGS
jgi:hypothetical protein